MFFFENVCIGCGRGCVGVGDGVNGCGVNVYVCVCVVYTYAYVSREADRYGGQKRMLVS